MNEPRYRFSFGYLVKNVSILWQVQQSSAPWQSWKMTAKKTNQRKKQYHSTWGELIEVRWFQHTHTHTHQCIVWKCLSSWSWMFLTLCVGISFRRMLLSKSSPWQRATSPWESCNTHRCLKSKLSFSATFQRPAYNHQSTSKSSVYLKLVLLLMLMT